MADHEEDIYQLEKQTDEALTAISKHDPYNAAMATQMQSGLSGLGITPVPLGMQTSVSWKGIKSKPDITAGGKTKSWSDWRDVNKGILGTDKGATGLDEIAMQQHKQGYVLNIDPVKTMTGLLGALSPNVSGATEWGPPAGGESIAHKIGAKTKNAALLKANTDNSVKVLAKYYTGRVKEVFERISAGLGGIPGITDEDDPL